MNNYGFIRAAAASPKLKVANPDYNVMEIAGMIKEADEKGAAFVVFPELSLTGYTCGDLFRQAFLLRGTLEALEKLLDMTKDASVLALVGAPLRIGDKLYNCGIALQEGRVKGVVPKMYLPNYMEFYEKRWFASGQKICEKKDEIELLSGEKVPFGKLIFKSKEAGFSLGMEICEDLWAPIPPSSYLALNGANVIANLSASNELVGKANYRRQLVAQQSARAMCAYVYASAGVHESTTDLVYGGDCIACENGVILGRSARFQREGKILFAEIDLDRLEHDRLVNNNFTDGPDSADGEEAYRVVEIFKHRGFALDDGSFGRKVEKMPFVPDDPATVEERCGEIFNIQVAGLAKRMEHIGSPRLVLGVSGGLDSTLALIVAGKTCELLGMSPQNITACTMPGFGTTEGTRGNAVELMNALGVTIREIDIRESCLRHFQDIKHDPDTWDVTYENVQARERMQVLMDIANKIGGIVVGTGDLSELALGWCTYNGDHMSMYAVNSGIPKTLVRFLVKWAADNVMTKDGKETLYRIIDTPISPELLPPDEQGRIRQETEDLIGPYELHDFFLFYTLRYGMTPGKILFLAEVAFKENYSGAEIKKWLQLFYKRFFSQQFKRSCMPDGPKVGSVNLSPRGDWRMPSDADVTMWLKTISR